MIKKLILIVIDTQIKMKLKPKIQYNIGRYDIAYTISKIIYPYTPLFLQKCTPAWHIPETKLIASIRSKIY